MEQLELFPVKEQKDQEEQLSSLDYVLVKEKGGYRLVHSYYHSSRIGQVITAEEALEALSLCAAFNLYAVVTFNPNLNLPRRKH